MTDATPNQIATEPDLIAAARDLIAAVTFDDSGVFGRGGNGGLLSRETIRKADTLRLIISSIENRTENAND